MQESLNQSIGQNELVQYLYRTTTPERTDEIKRSLELMTIVRGVEIEESANRLYQNIVSEQQEDPVRSIELAIFDWMYQTIRQFGISIHEDIIENFHLEVMNDLLFGLTSFETYEDVETLYHRSELQGTIKETFVNLMEIMTNRDSNQFLEIIDSISTQLLDNMKQMLTKRYKEEMRRLEAEAKEDKKLNTEAIRKKRETLYQYIDHISNGNEENAAWFRKFISKLISYQPEEILEKILGLVQTKKYTVNQQVGLWCIAVHLLNFIDATNNMENPTNRYQQCKEMIAKYYTDPNMLFTISHRVDEVIHGS